MGNRSESFKSVKAVSVTSNMDPDFMATRYCGLEASSSKYLSASQEMI